MATVAAALTPTTRRFHVGLGIFVILLCIAGFGPSIADGSHRRGPPTLLVMLHGAATMSFLFFFVSQATLIARRDKALHRRLGFIGGILAALVVIFGISASVVAQRRGFDLSGDLTRGGPNFTPDGIIGPLLLFFMFGVYVAAGIWYRNRPDIHKRLMVFALGPLGQEPVAHLFGYLGGYWPGLERAALPVGLLFVVFFTWVNAIHDKLTEGRVHRLSLWVAVASIVFFNVMFLLVGTSDAWKKFATWMLR